MNRPLYVWGLEPRQVALSFGVVAVLSVAFQAWGAVALLPVIVFARWSRKEIRRGNSKPLSTIEVKRKSPKNIIDVGGYYDSL